MTVDALTEVKRIACMGQLACVLEASTEKPGNVTPTHDFEDTTYGDFLAGSIALGPALEEAALRGCLAGLGEIALKEVGVGELMLRGVKDVHASHSGGNTHLGALMLMVPIAAGAGLCLSKGSRFPKLPLEEAKIIESSTLRDSQNLYSAIELCGAGGLGRLVRKRLPFSKLMEVSAKRDRIAEELSNGLLITFGKGLPYLENCLQKKPRSDMRESILWTYIYLLSKYPDTLIAKKRDTETAKEISCKAKEVLNKRLSIEEFDLLLRSSGNDLNPGTTADIVSAVVFLYLLKKNVF